jgi:hypothetical protein
MIKEINMDIMKYSEKIMLMDDKSWERHSNPWSVYTRFTSLPLLSVAFWSRDWLDSYCLIPISLSFLWIWMNPRLFSIPKHTNNWASMGTFGERIYLNRKNETIPAHHLTFCRTLLVFSALGLPFFLYGIYRLDFWVLVLGNVWIIVFKAWFVDRMVWLYLDMNNKN